MVGSWGRTANNREIRGCSSDFVLSGADLEDEQATMGGDLNCFISSKEPFAIFPIRTHLGQAEKRVNRVESVNAPPLVTAPHGESGN